jgi:hypothetical protein
VKDSSKDEVWRDIPSAPNYQASSHGRIRSLWFINRVARLYRPKILRATVQRGREGLSISIAGCVHRRSVHRLVCEAFHGPQPAGKECAHNNGNARDNRPNNLRWASKTENAADRVLHGTAPRGENFAVLDENRVREIRSKKSAGIGRRTLASEYCVDVTAIDKVVSRRTWKWVA